MLRSNYLAASLLAAGFAAAPAAYAQAPATADKVTADKVWARATPPGAGVGAVYLTLTSAAGDTLTGASTPVAATATVHEMSMTNGIMRMRPLESGLPLPAGEAVALRPGGYHIMLEGLKGPLKQGEEVPVHLTFKTAPPIDVTAQVESIGATSYATPGAAMPAAMPGMAPGMKMSP